MNITDYISKDRITLRLEDAIEHAISLMENTGFSHLPIVQNKKLYGSISESDLYSLDDFSKKIEAYNYLHLGFFATTEDSWIDILNLFASNETNILPIIDDKKEYIGFYDLSDILRFLSSTPFLKEEGSTLIVEKDLKQYSISEVSQIIETNNGKLLGLFISDKNETTIQLTLKINSETINEIIQSFRRYDYNVLSTLKDDSYLEELKNRSNYLLKYINV